MKFIIFSVLIAAIAADKYYPAVPQDQYIPTAPVPVPFYGVPAVAPKAYISKPADIIKNDFIETEKTLTFKTQTPEQNYKYVVSKPVTTYQDNKYDFEAPKEYIAPHTEYKAPIASRINPQNDDIVHADVYETDKTLTFKTKSLNQDYKYTVPVPSGDIAYTPEKTYGVPHDTYGAPENNHHNLPVHSDIPHSLDLPVSQEIPSGPSVGHQMPTHFGNPLPEKEYSVPNFKLDIPHSLDAPHSIELPVDSSISVVDDHNQYTHGFSLSDGTKVSEQGKLISTDDGWEYVIAKNGHYEYISPEGIPVKVNWVADENGFRVIE